MGATEVTKGHLEWTVDGLDRLALLEKRLESLEGHMGTGVPAAAGKAVAATDRVAQSHSLGGEKAARYLTTTGMLTGGLQRLGVQNDMVARTFSTFGDLLTGAAGPAGAIMVAVGAVGALAAHFYDLSQAQNRAKEATDAAIDSLLRQAAINNPSGAAARMLLAMREGELLDERNASLKEQSDLMERINRGYDVVQTGMVTASGQNIMAKKVFNKTEMQDLRKQAIELAVAIDTAEQKLRRLYGLAQGPDRGGAAAGKPPAATPGTTSGGIGGVPSFGSDVPTIGGYSGRYNDFSMIGPTEPTQMAAPAVDAYALIREAAKGSADDQVASLRYLWDQHRTTYAMMAAFTQSTSKASSTVVQKAIEGENVSRLKGVTIARFVASGVAAAGLREIEQRAEKKALFEAAESIAAFASGNIGGGLGHAAAATAFGALAGGAAGAAAGLESTAQRQMNSELGGSSRSGASSGDAWSRSASGGSNPGVRVAAAGASVGTVNYYFSISNNGPVVYGDGGTRDWFYRELVPLINEGISTNSISRN